MEAEADRTGTCCQVAEGDPIRILLTAIDGSSGDPAVEVRWRLFANPCDGAPLDANPIQEGSTLVQAGDPERILEVPSPDDWALQTTNRCLRLTVDFPGLAAPESRYEWLYTLLDNEARFPEGVTAWFPDLSATFGYGVPFVAAPDGSAFALRDLSDYPSGTLVRLRSDLSIDPQFHARLPEGFQIYDLEVLPNGGVVVWGNRGLDGTTLLKLNTQGVQDRTFQPEGLTNGVSVVRSDASGRLYVSDSRRLFRLRADGTIDPTFTALPFTGWLSTLRVQGEQVYVGGKFDTVAGLIATNVAVFRLHAVTGIDPNFSPALATNQSWGVSQVVETSDGRVITYGYPVLRVYSREGRLLSERTVDYVLHSNGPLGGGQNAEGSWGSLARLDGGMVVGGSWSSYCNGPSCQRSVSLESLDTGNAPSDSTRTIPSLNSAATGRLVSSGNFLWAEEKRENRIRFRRYQVAPVPGDSFGFKESKEFVTAALSHQNRGTIRRFGNSERRVELRLRVRLIETDSTVGFEPFTTSVVMEPGDVEKAIPLPPTFRPSATSVSQLRAELLPAEGVTVDGAGSLEFFVAGVEPSPSEPVLAVHQVKDGPWFQRVLVTLSAPEGSYTIRASQDGRTWWELDWDKSTHWSTEKIPVGSDHFAGVAELSLLTDPWGFNNEDAMYLLQVIRAP